MSLRLLRRAISRRDSMLQPLAADPEGADQIGDTFVSLESAKEALAAGVQRCQALLALLNPGGLAH